MSRRTVEVEGITPIVRGYPSAIVANGMVFVSGVRSGRPDAVPAFGDLPDRIRLTGTGFTLPDGIEGQVAAASWGAHDNLERVLNAAGTDGTQILRQHIWQRDKRFFPIYERVRMEWQKVPAPSSGLGVSDIVGRFGRSIGIDALAVIPGVDPQLPERATVRTFDNKEIPSASFYSQAVRCGPLVFLAGHIPIETEKPGKPVIRGFDDISNDGRFLETGRSHPDSRQGPIAAQSWYCYDRIRENLALQGLEMRDLLHVSVFLQDVRDFGTFHRVHRHFFPDGGPALVVTGFDEVGHKGTLIEIEPTAVERATTFSVSAIDWPIPAPFAGPAAVKTGPLWFLAGMLGLDSQGNLVRGVLQLQDPIGQRVVEDLARFETSDGFAAQGWQAWRLIEQVCARAGLSLSNIVKTTVYMRNPTDLWIYEEIREAFINARSLPAVEFVAVPGPGPSPDAHVQIEVIASEDA
jgi:enamine deaminase RidA (YjgF/YER057c/UK114 family)